jgi:hypothetical protein
MLRKVQPTLSFMRSHRKRGIGAFVHIAVTLLIDREVMASHDTQWREERV